MVTPTDVDMAPDDSLTSPLAADLAMEEDTLDLDAPVEYDTLDVEEEGTMAVSEDEQDELTMEDPEEVSAEVEEDVVGAGETDMLLEPSDTVDDATSAVEESLGLEVEEVVEPEAEAEATVDVDISGLPSPAPVVTPSTQPDLDDQPDDPADATDLPLATDNILKVGVAVSLKPESFVLLETPSEAEDNGKPAVAEEAEEDDPGFNHAESEESAVVLEETVTEEQDGDEVQLEIQDLEDFDGAIDSSSTSSQAGIHDDTAFFSVASDSEPPMPITISFQRIGSEVDSDALETITYSLFVPSDLPSTSTTPLPKVILGSQSNLYEAAMSELFDALRQEAEFSDEAGVLAIDDEDGTREWVLEHCTEAICLAVGEDNISARDTTLAHLAHVHRLCDLPEPMELRLRAGEVRFKQRIEMIAQMRDMMDDEESRVDVDELEEEEEEEEEDLMDAEERHAGVDHEDSDVHGEDNEEGHDEIIDEGEHEEKEEGSEEVTGRPDFEQGENEEDELEEGVPEPEESDQLADTPVDQAVEDRPNDFEDPEVSEQVNDGPGADVENEAGSGDDSDPSGIATDPKIVQTADGDLGVPPVAQHVETQLGSFDKPKSILQVGIEDPVDKTVVGEAPPDDHVENDQAADLDKAAGEEASADSTVEATVETVPVPARFTEYGAVSDDVLIMEEYGDSVDAGAQSDVSPSIQAVKRKRHGSDSSEARRSTRSAKLAKPQAVVAAVERDIYDDSPLPTPAPEIVQDLHADSVETGDDSGSAESELIIVEEGDEEPDEIGAEDEEDRGAKRLRAD